MGSILDQRLFLYIFRLAERSLARVRILFYGGCHAHILHSLCEEAFGDQVEIRQLINFKLIESGKPFPTELLDWCDALVYSPIENKGDYNTIHLRGPCEARAVRMLAFPWLEWHGYTPGASKGDFKHRYQWFWSQLVERAGTFSTFKAFHDHVVDSFPDDATIDLFSSDSLARLAASEERHDMEIRVSGFIKAHHRSSRLFLISDHPSLAIYRHVIEQIAACFDLALRPIERAEEPQWQLRMPILPRVRERLGLAFGDQDWVDDELIPGEVLDLETYLSLYYHPDGVILGAKTRTDIRLPSGPSSRATPVAAGTRLFANPVADNTDAGLAAYDVLAALSGRDLSLPPRGRIVIERADWRSTWRF